MNSFQLTSILLQTYPNINKEFLIQSQKNHNKGSLSYLYIGVFFFFPPVFPIIQNGTTQMVKPKTQSSLIFSSCCATHKEVTFSPPLEVFFSLSPLLINILDPVIFLSLLYQWHLATGSQFATGKSLSNLISTALQELPVPHLLLVMMFSLPTDQQLNQHRNLLLKVNSRTN